MSAKPAFEPALRAYAVRERRALDDHPSPEILVAYCAGELAGEEEEDLRDHLALCPECAEMLLDLVAFEEFKPPETPGLADAEVEAAWHRVQPRLGVGGKERLATVAALSERLAEPRTSRKGSEYESVVWRPRLRRAYALAAMLAVAVVGLTVWGTSLHRTIQRISGPQANPVIADAASERDGTRGDSEEEPTAPGEEMFFLVLHPLLEHEISEFPEYGAEIREIGTSGAPIVRLDGLIPAKGGAFSVRLPGKSFPAGEYRIIFFGVDGKRWQELDRLTFSITSP